MRSAPFFIEIPDRPVYQPGLGPAMAPITLHPDDSDTGWVIADTIEFQGVVQYVVTPADNPAHRRPVKKQHILDWVSAKAHEDFEYIQYKRQVDEERDRERKILAKAAAFRERRFGKGYAGGKGGTRKPFAKYMQLDAVEDSETGLTSGHLSSPDHSPEEFSEDALPGHAQTAKRKRSIGMMRDNTPSVKRRGLLSMNSPSLMWEPWRPSVVESSRHFQVTLTKDEVDTEVEVETAPDTASREKMHLDLFKRQTLQTSRKSVNPPRPLKSRKSFASSFAAPSIFVPARASPLRLSPKMRWSTLGPPIRDRINIPKSASPPDLLKTQAFTKAESVQAPQHRRDRPASLPPTLSRLATPPTQSEGLSSKIANDDLSFQILSRNPEISDKARNPRRQKLSNDEGPNQKMDIRSSSSSSGSSSHLRLPSDWKGSNVANERPKYIGGLTLVPDATNETEDEMEAESEESWEIDGILDDKLLRVNGYLVRHYLCEWIGDYEPTWEPRENVSAAAIQTYEKKKQKQKQKRREDLGLDGAADIDTVPEKSEASRPKIMQSFDDDAQYLDKESDSGDFMDVFSDAAMFLTPAEKL